MRTHDVDAAVRGLKPRQATEAISDDAWTELSEAVTSAESAPRLRRPHQARRLALVAACTLLIAGAVVATVVDRPHQDRPQALSFTEQGDKLIVRVVDPNADPKRYNEEFQRMGLDVTVLMVPVSPPWVGKMISFSARNDEDMSQLQLVEAGESCNGTLTASDPACQVGVELPKNYRGTTSIQFGRAARPGEWYQHTSSHATDKGEILAGLTVRNKTVAQVVPLVESHGARVEFLTGDRPKLKPLKSAPGEWYVEDAVTYGQGEVTLYVSPTPVS